jgi:hypothetical protein
MGLFSGLSGGVDYSDLIHDFNKLQEGAPLPLEGPCAFIYNNVSYDGETIALRHKKGYVFFHVDHDDVIQEIKTGLHSWHADTQDGKTILSIIFKTGELINRIQITIDPRNQDSLGILAFITRKKKIEINLLGLAYGTIIKETTRVIPVPQKILEELKKAAG